MSSVLFDVPGPKARARHRIIGAMSTLVLAGFLGWIIYVLASNDQFTKRRWAPFTDPDILRNLFQGLLFTLSAAAFAIALALAFGGVFAVGRLSDHAWFRWPSGVVVEFFRAVPLILLILFIFLLVGDAISRFWCLVLGLMLYNGAVLAEIFRAGISSVARGQSEAGYALGLRKIQVMRLILAPQAVRAMLPAIISQCVVALKDTALGVIISTEDITGVAKRIYLSFQYQNPIVVGIVLAAVFITINYSLSRLAQYSERRLARRGVRVVHIEDIESGTRGAAA